MAETAAPKRNSVAHAWVTDPVLLELESEAMRRGLHRDRLTAAIVDKVIRNGLVDTLLDNPRLA